MKDFKEQLKNIDINKLQTESNVKEFYIAVDLCYDGYYRPIEEQEKNYGKYNGNINKHIVDIQNMEFVIDEKSTISNKTTCLVPKEKNKKNMRVLWILKDIAEIIDFDFDYDDEELDVYDDEDYYDTESLIDDNNKIFFKVNMVRHQNKKFIPTKMYIDKNPELLDGYWSAKVVVEYKEEKEWDF